MSPTESLNIYHRGVKAKALSAIRRIYPVCQRLLGTTVFDAIVTEFISCHPSNSSDFADFAAPFVEFMTNYRTLGDCSYIADIACLEWHIYQLLKEIDSTGLDLEALAQVNANNEDQLVFHLPVGAVLMHSNYPLDEIWTVNQPDYQGNALSDHYPRHFQFLVWRAGFGICIDRLTQEEWLVLEKISTGVMFGDLCEQLFALHPDLDIAVIFPHLVEQGWIAGFHVTNSSGT